MGGNKNERTFIMVKPDGVHRGLVHKVLERFERKGYQMIGVKTSMPTRQHLEEHYKDLKNKPFFPGLVSYMAEGPVVCFCFQGLDVVKQGRVILGETDPLNSLPGTLRGDFCVEVGRNCFHGSDSVEAAEREIKLWFDTKEMITWTPHINKYVYE